MRVPAPVATTMVPVAAAMVPVAAATVPPVTAAAASASSATGAGIARHGMAEDYDQDHQDCEETSAHVDHGITPRHAAP